MSACPQCGTVAKPTDKFCNVCGTPITRASAAPAAAGGPPAYGAPPQAPAFAGPPPAGGGFGGGPPPPAFGAPPGGGGGARCQMGHEIAPGASYCAQGHPIALDQMQFANDPYGGGGQQGYAPQPGQGGFGAPPPAYGAPPAPPAPAFGAPPPAPGFAPPPAGGGFGAAPPPPAPAFGAPPPAPGPAFPPPAQPGGFGGPPPPAPAFGGPAPAPAFGGPPPQNDTARDAVPAKIVRGFLVAYGTNPAGDFWPLTGGRLTVGRLGSADGIDISLQDPTISSRHAALVVDGPNATVTIEDTGSTNGTFVNDEHIGFNGRRELRDGDRLRFGGFTTIVKVVGRV